MHNCYINIISVGWTWCRYFFSRFLGWKL